MCCPPEINKEYAVAHTSRPTRSRLIATLALLATAIAPVAAQDWPNRPVTMVVPLAAGGGSDGLSRVFAPTLGEVLGQTVIVENVGGVGGMIGASRVAKAPADGYQFLLGTSGTQALNQALYSKPLYNAATDFTAVSLVFDVPLVLMTKPDLPVNNLKEFIDYAKKNQKTMQYGSSGLGGTGHLACELLNSAMGVEITHIPYRGGGPAMNDLLAGRIDYQCALANIAMPPIENKQAKGIAVLSKGRSPILPDLASAQEQGLKDFEATAWNGIFLPKGTPDEIVKKLNAAISKTLDTPFVRDRLKEMGAEVATPDRRSPEFLQKHVETEIKKWAQTIKDANIKQQ
jgi:tripartite-type tricarboxylate transporter receptor subunit TctC